MTSPQPCPKIHAHSEPQNVALFVDVVSLTLSNIVLGWALLKAEDWCPYKVM